MIDDEKAVYELIEALNDHLPMRAYATPPLVEGNSSGGGVPSGSASFALAT